MALKASAASYENAIAEYVAGKGCESTAARHGVGANSLKAVLVERGLWRSRQEVDAARARNTSAGLLAKTQLPVAEIVERYAQGESVNAIAKAFGVSRPVIQLRLADQGVELRGRTDANRLVAARRSPEENAQFMLAAQSAVRGSRRSAETLARRANTRERLQRGVSPTERHLAELLSERGLNVIPQKAIGPYNVDVATGSIAVEIFGGGWHAYGAHRDRSAERFRYILDEGWNLVIIWVVPRRYPLVAAAADYVVAFSELTGKDPSVRGQYRVIWGDGEVAPTVNLEVDDLSAIPPRRGRQRSGPSDHSPSD